MDKGDRTYQLVVRPFAGFMIAGNALLFVLFVLFKIPITSPWPFIQTEFAQRIAFGCETIVQLAVGIALWRRILRVRSAAFILCMAPVLLTAFGWWVTCSTFGSSFLMPSQVTLREGVSITENEARQIAILTLLRESPTRRSWNLSTRASKINGEWHVYVIDNTSNVTGSDETYVISDDGKKVGYFGGL